MGDGVSPKMNGKLLDGKEKEEDVYEDALMEVTADESEKVATAAVEEKTTPANAEVPGSKAEEANPEEGWQRVEGRTRRAPTPPLPPLEKPLEFGEFHLQIWGSIAHRADVLRMIGGPADVRWCAMRGTEEYPSSRSFGMVLPLNKMVCTAAQAGKEKSWVVGKMWEDEDGVVHVTRYRLDLCGKAPTSWGRRGAPAAPEERQQQYGAALRGHANRAADVRAAWTQQQQFPPLPRQTAQQPELQELQARIVKIEYKMEQFVAQGQAPASAAATPAQGEGNERERDLKQKVQELEGQVAELKTTQQKMQKQQWDSFAKEQETRFANEKHLATIRDLEARLWKAASASSFITPEKPGASGGLPLSVPVGVQFAAGVGGESVELDTAARRLRVREQRGQRQQQLMGRGETELQIPRGPLPIGWDFRFNPVVRVPWAAPAAPVPVGSPGELGSAASGQTAGEEKAKETEASKEGGQSAAAEAPAAVSESEDESWVPADPVSLGGGEAEPAGAAVWPQGREGGKVRPPVRPQGESGDTPEPKAAKRNEQEGAVAPEAAGARLAPARLAWSTVAGRNGRGIRAGVRVGVGGSKPTRHYATK
jgi:hypothetical protein